MHYRILNDSVPLTNLLYNLDEVEVVSSYASMLAINGRYTANKKAERMHAMGFT